MRLLLRLAMVCILGAASWWLFTQAKEAEAAANDSKKVLCFLGVVVTAIGGGAFLAFSVLPGVAEQAGNLFYAPAHQIEKSPHAAALAKISQGDFAGAVAEYEKVFEKDPGDTHALSEIARLYCEKLHEPQKAAAALEKALEHEWPQEAAAFIANRLVDVYWKYQQDALRARQLLVQIAESMPETRHAQNALHRIEEMDRALQQG